MAKKSKSNGKKRNLNDTTITCDHSPLYTCYYEYNTFGKAAFSITETDGSVYSEPAFYDALKNYIAKEFYKSKNIDLLSSINGYYLFGDYIINDPNYDYMKRQAENFHKVLAKNRRDTIQVTDLNEMLIRITNQMPIYSWSKDKIVLVPKSKNLLRSSLAKNDERVFEISDIEKLPFRHFYIDLTEYFENFNLSDLKICGIYCSIVNVTCEENNETAYGIATNLTVYINNSLTDLSVLTSYNLLDKNFSLRKAMHGSSSVKALYDVLLKNTSLKERNVLKNTTLDEFDIDREKYIRGANSIAENLVWTALWHLCNNQYTMTMTERCKKTYKPRVEGAKPKFKKSEVQEFDFEITGNEAATSLGKRVMYYRNLMNVANQKAER